MNKIEIFRFGFLDLVKVSGTYRVDLVRKLFALFYFVFVGVAPIPYVQAAILNLPHPYLRSTTALLD